MNTKLDPVQIKQPMATEKRIQKLFEATPSTLVQIDALLNNEAPPAANRDIRLLTFSNAAKALGVSRQTVHRMVAEHRLPTVELRQGSRRVPSAALTALVSRAESRGGRV
jgi:excisionase family DNA binding protein